MPDNAIYVGRPTKWGNPWSENNNPLYWMSAEPSWREQVVAAYEWGLGFMSDGDFEKFIEPLRGKDLACWCPLDQPCHADVLLEMANE